MRYTIEYQTDCYDEPEQYTIKDTVSGIVVAHIFVPDFRAQVPVSEDFIVTRRALIEAELKALDHARVMAALLETANDAV